MSNDPIAPRYEFRTISSFNDCSGLLKSSDYIIPSITLAELAGTGLNDVQAAALVMYCRNMMKKIHCGYPFDPDRQKLQAIVRRFQVGKFAEKQARATRAVFEGIMHTHPAGAPLFLKDDLATPVTLAALNALLGCEIKLCDVRAALTDGYKVFVVGLTPTEALDGWLSLGPLASVIDEIIETQSYAKDGLLAALCDFASTNNRPRDFVVMSCAILLIAGSSLIRSLNSIMKTSLANPDLRNAMTSDNIDNVFRELLRLDPPQPILFRYEEDKSTQEVRQFVAVNLGEANRDPERFECPAHFDPNRSQKGTLTFGIGPYACDGAPMTLMFLRETVRPLLTRTQGLKLLEKTGHQQAALQFDSFE